MSRLPNACVQWGGETHVWFSLGCTKCVAPQRIRCLALCGLCFWWEGCGGSRLGGDGDRLLVAVVGSVRVEMVLCLSALPWLVLACPGCRSASVCRSMHMPLTSELPFFFFFRLARFGGVPHTINTCFLVCPCPLFVSAVAAGAGRRHDGKRGAHGHQKDRRQEPGVRRSHLC